MTQPPPAAPPATPRREGRVVRDPGGPLGARLAWTVIVALVGLIALSPVLAPLLFPVVPIDASQAEQGAAEGTGAEAAGAGAEAAPAGEVGEEADLAAPGIFGEALKPIVLSGDPDRARAELKMASGMFVRGPPDRIRIAIVAGDAISPEAALEHLARIDRETLGPGLRQDVQTLETLYREGPGAVSATAGERLAVRYGWFGRLAFDGRDEGPARAALLEEARRIQLTVSTFNWLLVGALVAGVGLFVAAVTLLLTGRLKRAYAAPAPGGSAYLEMFAVFLGVYLVVSIGIEALAPAIGPWHHVLRWVMLGVVAWPLLRGAPWRQARFALGWHTGRGPLREIGLGVVGYTACLPIVGIGLAITLGMMALWGVLTGAGEEGSAPTHPIGDMLAQAGPIEIAMLLMVGVLWAPVVEETVFRGGFYHHLRGRLGVLGAGLVTGFVFAAIHPQGLFAIPVLTSVGFVFCLLREWRGSLLAPIAAHALNNGFILTLMLLVML